MIHATRPTTLKILIGDDHRIVREGLKQVLADAPEIEVVAVTYGHVGS
jgi:DNA-binding NarL/FixJ family response regulator